MFVRVISMDNRGPLPTTKTIVISLIFSVIVGIAWAFGLLVAAWMACGGDFGGLGAGANQNLDSDCQARHSSTAWRSVVFVPIAIALLLMSLRARWNRSSE